MIQQLYIHRLHWQNGCLGTEVVKVDNFFWSFGAFGFFNWVAGDLHGGVNRSGMHVQPPLAKTSVCQYQPWVHVLVWIPHICATLEQLEGGTSPLHYWIQMNVAISQHSVQISLYLLNIMLSWMTAALMWNNVFVCWN